MIDAVRSCSARAAYAAAVTAVLDLFTLNNVMLVKHRHIELSPEKTNWYFETKKSS